MVLIFLMFHRLLVSDYILLFIYWPVCGCAGDEMPIILEAEPGYWLWWGFTGFSGVSSSYIISGGDVSISLADSLIPYTDGTVPTARRKHDWNKHTPWLIADPIYRWYRHDRPSQTRLKQTHTVINRRSHIQMVPSRPPVANTTKANTVINYWHPEIYHLGIH